MTVLPTGTVTFLFTDVDGSTRLLQELGDAYEDNPRPRPAAEAGIELCPQSISWLSEKGHHALPPEASSAVAVLERIASTWRSED